MFQCSDGNSAQDNSSLKRVAVVEDFFDIIYAMHVEMGADPGRAPKHAGQKKTYKAVGESCMLWLTVLTLLAALLVVHDKKKKYTNKRKGCPHAEKFRLPKKFFLSNLWGLC